MRPPPRLDSRVLEGGLAITTLELLLGRITDAPPGAADVLLGAALPLPLALLAGRLGPRGAAGAQALLPALALAGLLSGSLGLTPSAVLAWIAAAGAVAVWAVGGEAGRGLSPRGAVGVVGGTALLAISGLLNTDALEPALPPGSIAALATGAALAALVLGRWAPILVPLAFWPEPTRTWSPNEAPPATGPDVVLITVDTLRLDEASQLASLADLHTAELQAPAPWTLPSLASVQSGQWPWRHGAVRVGEEAFSVVPAEVQTLAERLRAAGWDTAAAVETPFADASFGLVQGFDLVFHHWRYRWRVPRAPDATRTQPALPALLGALGLLPSAPWGADERLAEAEQVLEMRRDRPIFLWIHYFDAHLPMRHARDLDLPLLTRNRLAGAGRASIGATPSRESVAELRLARREELRRVDASIAALRRRLAPDTVIVVSSDHGEELMEHGGFEHGHAFWQELLAVPLFSTLPLQAARGSLVDIAPSILAALGLPSAGMDGLDLALPQAANRPLGSVNPLYGPLEGRAVRVGDAKRIEHLAPARDYDLATDPGENQPTTLPELGEALPPLPSADAQDLSEDVKESLRSIGYIE